MIWIIEIPVIVFVIAAMMIGSLKLGAALRLGGIVLLALAGISYLIRNFKQKANKEFWGALTILNLIIGGGLLLVGSLMGDLNLFEFLFGTGWF